ncbi:hypothetical protein [Neptunicella sp. SCSIO 80796]|uniref:hypothetical protein n=1 Tax=Neptunicella plasticusilytica TaxID=3117012 RepID=UPI003A4DDCD1
MNHKIRFAIVPVAVITSSLLTGCIVHVGGGDGSSRHHSYRQDDDKQISGTAGDISSINDDIKFSSHTTAGHVDAVNGDIKISDNVELRSINTVNGDIRAGHKLASTGPIETVNGDIEIESGSSVVSISTVNGDIELEGVQVQHNISTQNGDISLRGDTHILGDVIFEKRDNPSGWNWGNSHDRPELEIDTNVRIDGNIVLNRQVELQIANPQLKDKIIYRDKR